MQLPAVAIEMYRDANEKFSPGIILLGVGRVLYMSPRCSGGRMEQRIEALTECSVID